MISILLALLFVVVVGFVDWRSNPRSPKVLTFVAGTLFYFMFGPIIAHQVGLPIYKGIDIAYLDRAALLSTLCLGAFAAGAALGVLPQRRHHGRAAFRAPTATYQALADVMFVGLSLAAVVLAVVNLDRMGAPKDVTTFWPGHYRFLLAWMIGFIIRFSVVFRFDWIVFFGLICFVLYCTVFSERDFIFPVICFGFMILGSKRFGVVRFVPLIAAALLVVWLLSIRREGVIFESGAIVSLLNQSANVFVDTFTIKHRQLTGEMLWGSSYLASALKTLTFNLVYLGPPLAEWLVIEFLGPNVPAGFGFSLEAEAYLNFGYAGSAVVFLALGGLAASLLTAERLRSYGGRVSAVFAMTLGLYAIRGESLNLFKPALYVVLLILTLRGAAWLIDRVLDRRAAGAATRATRS
jgi:hypothetical protein